MDMNPAQLVERIDSMASFPEVALRVSEVIDDENSSITDVGAVVEPDPALSAALLRIANSASFNAGERVDNVAEAIKVVGLREVRDITYAISASTAFQGIPNELISVEDFWRHSLYCACAAQHLAKITKRCPGVSLFTAGLLHDIGQLIMFSQLPDQSRLALQNHVRSEQEVSVSIFEHREFGFDHTEVGEALARLWQFPDTLRIAIRYHHSPTETQSQQDLASLIAIANSIAVLAEIESSDLLDAPAIDESELKRLELSDEILFEAATVARDDAEVLLNLFLK